MVIAIAMQKLDALYAGLADSYYLAALPYLEAAVRLMNLETLQCFALIAQYSMVTPTRTASYWVVGLATRLCQELGLTDEKSITHESQDTINDALQLDMKRRLFWVITSMEYGLAHILGRPSAFGTGPNDINVAFFELCDDEYITKAGVVAGCPSSTKKQTAVHFFKMRLHQAEIRRKLYLTKRPDFEDDEWFGQMHKRLREWLALCPKSDPGNGLGEKWYVTAQWLKSHISPYCQINARSIPSPCLHQKLTQRNCRFRVRYNTIVILLYRPSPQIPEPSVEAALTCIEAALENIQLQREQIAKKSVDVTWIFSQTLFMELNTALWALSYPEVRQRHPKNEIEEYVQMAQDGIRSASERWPGVESALELYENLIKACLKAYSGNTSYVIRAPSIRRSSASPHESMTPPPLSTSSTVASSDASRDDPQIRHSISYLKFNDGDGMGGQRSSSPPAISESSSAGNHQESVYHLGETSQAPSFQSHTPYQNTSFDPNSLYNPLPVDFGHCWNLGPSPVVPHAQLGAYSAPQTEPEIYFDTIGEQYSQYLHAPYPPQQPLQCLNHEQQFELMTNLEKTGLKG